MIFSDFQHKRQIDNFDPYNIVGYTNIPLQLMTSFVVQGQSQGHILLDVEKQTRGNFPHQRRPPHLRITEGGLKTFLFYL